LSISDWKFTSVLKTLSRVINHSNTKHIYIQSGGGKEKEGRFFLSQKLISSKKKSNISKN
jgi:hypothetical protein